jgi:phosphate transport system substrate-binding protein
VAGLAFQYQASPWFALPKNGSDLSDTFFKREKPMRTFLTGAVACAVAFAAVAPATARADSLSGSGSSFVKPMMDKWARTYEQEKKFKVDYIAVGSSAGVKQFLDKATDFACSDAPLTDEQLAAARKAGDEVVHVPLVMGGVVPAYNLKGVDKPIRFTGKVLAGIYLGKIKRWNDNDLKEINPGLDLPDLEIIVAHRADGSGSTAIFTDFLTKTSPDWKANVGTGTTVKWPTGSSAKGTDGVANLIDKTPGAIGYVELVFALQKKMKFGAVKNKEGNYVLASLEGVTAAAEAALTTVPDDLRFSLTNAPGKESYPICGTTWAIVHVRQPEDKAKEVVNFLGWVTHDGQEYATDLYYARLPQGLVERLDKKLALIKPAK